MDFIEAGLTLKKEDFADGETQTRNPSVINRLLCVQQNHCTSRMRSQVQLRNDKYIMKEDFNDHIKERLLTIYH